MKCHQFLNEEKFTLGICESINVQCDQITQTKIIMLTDDISGVTI